MTSAGTKDPFVWYALAMEYRSLDRKDDALGAFEKLRLLASDYVPTYLMCGQLLVSMGRPADARSWLEAGVEAADAKGDTHAASELRSALEAVC
jgi:hypothetical protein